MSVQHVEAVASDTYARGEPFVFDRTAGLRSALQRHDRQVLSALEVADVQTEAHAAASAKLGATA